jgi:hypothetical protein
LPRQIKHHATRIGLFPPFFFDPAAQAHPANRSEDKNRQRYDQESESYAAHQRHVDSLIDFTHSYLLSAADGQVSQVT